MATEINIRETLARDRVQGLRPHLRPVAQQTLRHLKIRGRDLSLLLTDDAEMRALNREWRNLDRTTDVLSFEGDEEHLGDVVISLDQAERQAARFKVSLNEELARLLVHGILHLLGHDHKEPAERRAMNALTEEILEVVSR